MFELVFESKKLATKLRKNKLLPKCSALVHCLFNIFYIEIDRLNVNFFRCFKIR